MQNDIYYQRLHKLTVKFITSDVHNLTKFFYVLYIHDKLDMSPIFRELSRSVRYKRCELQRIMILEKNFKFNIINDSST